MQRPQTKGKEAEVPPVHSSRPERREERAAPGLQLRPPAAAAAAVPAAADPEPAAAALQLPGHPACATQVRAGRSWLGAGSPRVSSEGPGVADPDGGCCDLFVLSGYSHFIVIKASHTVGEVNTVTVA